MNHKTPERTVEQELQFRLNIVKALRQYTNILNEALAKIALLEKENPGLRSEETQGYTTAFQHSVKVVVARVEGLEKKIAAVLYKV